MDDFTLSTPELATCAIVNFENFAKVNPALKTNPFWQIAMAQLNAVAERLAQSQRVHRSQRET